MRNQHNGCLGATTRGSELGLVECKTRHATPHTPEDEASSGNLVAECRQCCHVAIVHVREQRLGSEGEIACCAANRKAMSLTSAIRLLVRKDLCEALLLLLPSMIKTLACLPYHEHVLSLILARCSVRGDSLGWRVQLAYNILQLCGTHTAV